MAVPTFGGYVNGTQVVSAAANTEIQANIDKFLALLPDPANQLAGGRPDFDAIRPEICVLLRNEIAAMKAAIAAAPDA